MTPLLLVSRLEPVRQRLLRLGLWRRLAITWTVAALVAVVVAWAAAGLGLPTSLALAGVALGAALAAGVVAVRHLGRKRHPRALANIVERRHPELKGLLLTAVQQEVPASGRPHYLQQRLLREAIQHSHAHDWSRAVPQHRLALAQTLNLAALALLLGVLWNLRPAGHGAPSPLLSRLAGVTVTPGDTAIEKGENLVVLARFGGSLPAAAELVVSGSGAGVPEQRIALTRSLSDPIFGGSIPAITNVLSYRVAYSGRHTREYRVTVYEHPRLERADADLVFPEYTGLPPKRIEDTRRFTAVEGTRLDLALQFNKPVTTATLIGREPGLTNLSLVVSTNASAALPAFTLGSRGAYQLHLVDADGRTNKLPALFTFDVVPNRTPELKLAAPRGDQRPSALEEVVFQGTAWDDFGMPACGLAYTVVGRDTVHLELARSTPAGEKLTLQHLLRLEELSVQPDDLVSWFLWADDIGPDGRTRRTTSDLFFGEIRPFEEVFREAANAGGEPEQGGQEGGQGSPTTRLADLQKQIINATWKLQRTHPRTSAAYEKDAAVVRDSQSQARERAESLQTEASEARERALWAGVLDGMDTALLRLSQAASDPAGLPPAIAAEQAAYQALLKLQTRETQVARARQQGGGGGGGARNQRQLDQLDLTETENRYETQRQAQAGPTAERREQLNILNRLQELAQRQEDVNERLKELQTALQEARNADEREEIRRRLKRLQEEQQQMLADADELQQRLQRPENQSRTTDQQRQLDQARTDMQRASEATRQGSVSQALASGSRAERQLEQMRDELRRETSGEFAEELRQMRAEARDLARRQEDLTRDLQSRERPGRRSLGAPDGQEELASRLGQQRDRLTNLVDRATQVSQAAEPSEPLVSRQLYDALRQLSQDEAQTVKELQDELLSRGLMNRGLYERLQQLAANDGPKSLDLTSELLRQGLDGPAAQSGTRARQTIDTLRRGVERAAENVLGDDAAALRIARDELESLAEQVEREIAAAGGQAGLTNAASAGGQDAPGSPELAAASPGRRGEADPTPPPGDPGSAGGDDPSEPRSPEARQGASGAPGQQGQPGQRAPQGGQQGGQGRPAQLAQDGQAGAAGGQPENGRPGASGTGGGRNPRGGAVDLDRLLGTDRGRSGGGADGGGSGTGPITGETFGPWSDRLREVEEMIDLPELRNDVATARERARITRLELRRDLKKPDWAVVRLQVVKPLVEVRSRIDEELARRSPDNELVPIDRDPVPGRYTELVRRYYEELGKDR